MTRELVSSLPLLMHPPDDLSDDAIYAISEYLQELCRSFENHHYAQIRRYSQARDGEEPF